MTEKADTPAAPRPLKEALLKGWKRRCPQCGAGGVFDGYLKVRDECDICGEALHHHRADDAPSWLTIIITGHILGPLMLLVYELADLPLWVHLVAWPTIGMVLVVALLPRVKGAIVAFQWANRMHGFEGAGRN